MCFKHAVSVYPLPVMIKSFRESIAILLFGWVFVKASKLRDVLGNGGIDSYLHVHVNIAHVRVISEGYNVQCR